MNSIIPNHSRENTNNAQSEFGVFYPTKRRRKRSKDSKSDEKHSSGPTVNPNKKGQALNSEVKDSSGQSGHNVNVNFGSNKNKNDQKANNEEKDANALIAQNVAPDVGSNAAKLVNLKSVAPNEENKAREKTIGAQQNHEQSRNSTDDLNNSKAEEPKTTLSGKTVAPTSSASSVLAAQGKISRFK